LKSPLSDLKSEFFYGFDYIEFYVSNAKQAATFFTARMGFEYYAYKGLETGSRDYCSHVVSNGDVKYVFTSPLNPGDEAFGKHLTQHGDGVHDVAFTVDDARGIYEKAVGRGAKSITKPTELTDDNGTVIISSVQTYGDTIHTFVQRDGYKGLFMPGFKEHHLKEPFNTMCETP
jgi:4-hydroxyphenylpyruvate dioxygenase